MFFIAAIDFWIHRFEEHMQKIITDSFSVATGAKSDKIKRSTEGLILDLFKIHGEIILPVPVKNTEDVSKYNLQYGDKKIQFDLIWNQIITGEHDFLVEKIDTFFNPESTTIGLTQFKLLLVFRLQQKCITLRQAAYLKLVEKDTLRTQTVEQSGASSAGSVPETIDEPLLQYILLALNQIRRLMRTLEEKAALKINQFTVTPSDGRTGNLLSDFEKTIDEIFQFFKVVDQDAKLQPGQDQALLDASPEKIAQKNDPLFIVYENVVPYLLSNYSRLASFDRLSQVTHHHSGALGVIASFLSFMTQPIKTVGDQCTLQLYDPVVAEKKRAILRATIAELRKFLQGQSIVNDGIWDNCDRTLVLQSEEAEKIQSLSLRSQELTLFFDRTRKILKESRESLQQKKIVPSSSSLSAGR